MKPQTFATVSMVLVLGCISATANTPVPAPGAKPVTATATVATSAPSACSAREFRRFDFWAGTWEVVDAGGKRAGRNTITIEQRGCVLVERWSSASGGTGLSINYYDPRSRTWTQQWIGLDLLLTMTGGMRDGSMVLEGPLQYLATGKLTTLRGTWTALPDGRVRQHFQESEDGGKTWTEWFDGYYTRAAGS